MSHYTDLANNIEKSILETVGAIQGAECIKELMRLDHDNNYVSKHYKAVMDSALNRREFWISWIGMFSSGKTTIINSSLEYPLLPVSPLRMTGAITRIRYSSKPYISIYNENKRFLKGFDGEINKELFKALEEFFIFCGSTVGLGNTRYFKDISGQISLNAKDIKQIVLLISTLFAAYVNQNESGENLNENELKLLELREKIFRTYFSGEIAEAAISGKTFILEIGWDAPVLASGLCFVDLPGLNSTVTKDNENFHDIITNEALKNTDAVVVTFEGKDFDGDTKAALEKWLNSAKIKAAVSKESRIIGLINKIDSLADVDDDLHTITKKIKAVFRSYDINDVSIFGVSALYASEARFFDKGIIDKHNFSGKTQKEIKGVKQEEVSEYLLEESRFAVLESFLYDYAVKCKVIAASEAVCLINSFMHSVFDLAVDVVYSRNIVRTNSDIAFDEIITFLKDLNTKVTTYFSNSVNSLIRDKNIEIGSAFEIKWENKKSGFQNTLSEEIDDSLKSFMNNVSALPSGAAMLDNRLYLKKFDNASKLDSYFKVLKEYGISKFSKQMSDFIVELINLVKEEFNELDSAVGSLYRDFNKTVEKQYLNLWQKDTSFSEYEKIMQDRMLPPDNYDKYLEFTRVLKEYNENPDSIDEKSPYYSLMGFSRDLRDKLFDIMSIGNNIDKILEQISTVDEACDKMADEALTVMSDVYKAFSVKIENIKTACMKEFMLTGSEYVNRTLLKQSIDLINRSSEAQDILDSVKRSLDSNFFRYVSESEPNRIDTTMEPVNDMKRRGDNLLNGVYTSAGYTKAELIMNIKAALKIVRALKEANLDIQDNYIAKFKEYLSLLVEQHNSQLQWSITLKQDSDNMDCCYISEAAEAMLEDIEAEIKEAMSLKY